MPLEQQTQALENGERRQKESVRAAEQLRQDVEANWRQQLRDSTRSHESEQKNEPNHYYGFVILPIMCCGFLSIIDGLTACLMDPRALACHLKSAVRFGLI
jgi:hypothetical protein